MKYKVEYNVPQLIPHEVKKKIQQVSIEFGSKISTISSWEIIQSKTKNIKNWKIFKSLTTQDITKYKQSESKRKKN